MNYQDVDSFIAVIQVLSAKLSEKDSKIQHLETRVLELSNDNSDLKDRINRIDNQRADDARSYNDTISHLRTRCDELFAEVQTLRSENQRFKLGVSKDATFEHVAKTYMLAEGVKLYHTPHNEGGGKIQVIKHVRNLTVCGLKEAKDFVEAYMRDVIADVKAAEDAQASNGS